MQPDEFDMENGTLLGCGAIAYVNRVKHIPSANHFAIKAVSKIQALQQHKTDGLKLERQVLSQFSFHPGIVHLYGTMQTVDEIFFVLEMLTRGDLQEHIKRVAGIRRSSDGEPGTCLCRRDAQSIMIQVSLTLRMLWGRGVVVRDVKPENVAFHSNGRAVLVDFDTVMVDAPPLKCSQQQQQQSCKKDDDDDDDDEEHPQKAATTIPPQRISEITAIRRKSQAFCGTAQFVSPETLESCDWTFASDLFALGAMLYFMLAGRPLFDGDSAFHVMQKIRAGVAAVPTEQMAPGVRDCAGAVALIRKLLAADPRTRCCRRKQSNDDDDDDELEFDFESFKGHEFFQGAEDLWQRFEAEDDEVRKQQQSQQQQQQEAGVGERLKHPSQTPCARAASVSYKMEPKHDEEYAEYAMRSGASDVERWWLDAVEKMERDASGEVVAEEPKIDPASAAQQQEEDAVAVDEVAVAQKAATGGEEEDDDTMDVIDDVGQQQFITKAFSKDTGGDEQPSNGEDDDDV